LTKIIVDKFSGHFRVLSRSGNLLVDEFAGEFRRYVARRFRRAVAVLRLNAATFIWSSVFSKSTLMFSLHFIDDKLHRNTGASFKLKKFILRNHRLERRAA
jgi:hypothetical protein